MGYWDPPEYFDEAKFPEIDAETDTLIEHLVGAIKEEYKDKIAKESDAYQDLKASCDSLRRELTNKNSDLLAKDGLIETLNKELAKKKTEHPSFKFDIGETVFYVRAEYNSEKKAHCPRCNGKGYIELDAEKNNLPQDVTEPVKYLCPECKDCTAGFLYRGAKHFKEYSYYSYTVAQGTIAKIDYQVKENGETQTTYYVKNSIMLHEANYVEEDLYDNRDDALKRAQVETKLSRIKAMTSVGIAKDIILNE